MQAGVDDQAPGAKQLSVQRTEQRKGLVFIPAVVDRKSLGIERPAFRVGAAAAKDAALAPTRLIDLLLLQGELEMMARHCLMDGQAAHLRHIEFRPGQWRPEHARPTAIRRRRAVVGRSGLLGQGRFAPHFDRRRRL